MKTIYREILGESYYRLVWKITNRIRTVRTQRVKIQLSDEDLWQAAVLAWWEVKDQLRDSPENMGYLWLRLHGALVDQLAQFGCVRREGKRSYEIIAENPVDMTDETMAHLAGEAQAGDPVQRAMLSERAAIVRQVLADAPSRSAALWNAIHGDGITYQEAAATWGLTQGRAHQICRGLQQQMQRLEDQCSA